MNDGAARCDGAIFNFRSMRRLFTIVLLSALTGLGALAQQRYYLFSEFMPGEISFKGYSRPENVIMNIDAMGQRIFYFQGETLMELTNASMIDTLKINGKKFVMKDALLCEQMAWQNDTVYVNWKFKRVNKGSKGALGFTTQAKVEVLHSFEFTPATPFPVTDWHLYSEDGDGASVEVWTRKNDNTYFFSVAGQEYKAKRLKDLYQAFPAQAPALKAYVKEKKYTMENAQQALSVIAYLKSL